MLPIRPAQAHRPQAFAALVTQMEHLWAELHAPDKEVHMTECSGGGWSGPWHSNFISNMRRLFVGGSNNWAQ